MKNKSATFQARPACAKCGLFPIVNKTHMLCMYCNFERLNSGMTYKDFNKEKKEKQKREKLEKMKLALSTKSFLNNKKCSIDGCLKKIYTTKNGGMCFTHFMNYGKNNKNKESKKRVYIKPLSNKERIIKQELSKLKKETKQKYIENNSQICEGCKKHTSILDYSHILSVKQRKDLELHPDNKNMLCRSCHEKWESWDAVKMSSLNCFYDNMKFIRIHDKERFWKIYFIFNDALMMSECKEIEKIDEEYLKIISNEQ